ncbi:FAD-dependent oxidoreductase [Paludicola sp. MB14-C6]|uniref:oxidoreductase n=1 Tax=Paludihabitans sp. MB14-C6 TaxID=3070656 RepID=UPI0027DC2544|nr:FAD-dependent oxidoreductase [Paludicola sp. MB14-C6]WMJ22979.1 FAD-dependent oxidoreductase [Paludicola sp. MB14-C6]
MKQEYEALFTPWKIGNVEIKNRIVMCSMGGTSIFGWMKPNHFDKEAANFLLERAKNNVGLILPGIAPIRDTMGGKWLYQNKGKFNELKKFMDEFHKTGAKMFIQLTAGMGRAMAVNDLMVKMMKNKALGTLGKPIFNMDYICASASATPNRWADDVYSRPLTKEEIHEIVEAFAKTAKLCMDAGVDGIEVHAVHEGYMLDQFTLKYTNQRTDEYGGSFENRYRFPAEIVQAIKKTCGNDFPVSLRYSVVSKTKGFRKGAVLGDDDYIEVGRDMEESEKAAKFLQDAGYDMLNCDNGTYDSWYWAHPPAYMPENCNLSDVSHIKNFVTIPVVCAGKMTPSIAAEAIKEGKLDAMGVARQFLTDPSWVKKLMENREEDIKPCINCHNACFTMAKYEGTANIQDLSDAIHMARCALEPRTMQSKKYKIEKASKAKNIAVIGGGIGGMESALVLSQRGHNVTIYEKSDCLGGIFIQAAAPIYKEKDRELIEWYRREVAKYPITVKLNTEVKDIYSLQADEIIIATGSAAKHPPIKGIEHSIEAIDYLSGKEVGDNVIIVGGGLTGCEIAYDLILKGKKPQIVEMKNDLIAAKGICLANTSFLREMFAFKKTPIYLETTLLEINTDGVTVRDKDGKTFDIKGDSVIVSIGYNPTPLAKASRHVHLVGDANGVGNLRSVIWRAWDVCMKL